MNTLWTIAANPRKRRKTARRSAAQRAATRRMLAANRATQHNPKKRRRARKAAAAPVRRSARRSIARARRRISSATRGMGGGAVNLIKAGAIGAGGALVVDVAQGFVNGFLPASMNTKLNPDGTMNYLNYAVKGALAVGLAHFGSKVVSSETAKRMAVGSMTVMAYELLRPFAVSVLPASMGLGWYSPGATFNNPAVKSNYRVGQYQNTMGNYQDTRSVVNLRSPNATAANSRTLR